MTASLILLMKRAEDYASSGERSIFGFVRYIELLKKYNSDYGEASAVSGAEDTVRIVSIHRSKGLEYPIVILANMAKRFNLEDRSDAYPPTATHRTNRKTTGTITDHRCRRVVQYPSITFTLIGVFSFVAVIHVWGLVSEGWRWL